MKVRWKVKKIKYKAASTLEEQMLKDKMKEEMKDYDKNNDFTLQVLNSLPNREENKQLVEKGIEEKNEDILYPVNHTKYETVTVTYTKFYHGSLLIHAKLTDLERSLLIFCVEVMDLDNIINNTTRFKEMFLTYIQDNFDTSYSIKSIERCFKSLREKKLLFRIDKGVYKINPKFFWKNKESLRYQAVKDIMEAIDRYNNLDDKEKTNIDFIDNTFVKSSKVLKVK